MRHTGLLSLALFIMAATIGIWWLVLADLGITPSKQAESVTTNNPADIIGPGVTEIPQSANVFVPILMYHYIRDYQNRPDDPIGEGLSVSPAVFSQQLATLKTAGYQTITLTDFVNREYGSKPLVITFDDGYEDAFTAGFPILEENKMKATFFIVKNFIGRPNYLTENQIRQLKNAGMEIGGHSLNHKNLANLQYEAQVDEIAGSLINRDQVFCYPSGKYDLRTLDVVSGLGLKAAVTTNLGVATDKSKIYELPRIRVKEKTDLLKKIKEETAIAKRELAPSQRSPN